VPEGDNDVTNSVVETIHSPEETLFADEAAIVMIVNVSILEESRRKAAHSVNFPCQFGEQHR
jgi:hypothetical protein